MQMNAYLLFNGQCEAAFKFYEQCLGGKIEAMIAYAGTPAEEQVPPEWRDKIMHVTLKAGGGVLMASDAPPGRYEAPKGFSVSIGIADLVEAERIFTHWRKTERCGCQSSRLFGPPNSACWWTASEFRG